MKENMHWIVTYDHKDGRSGTVNVTTTLEKIPESKYGNQTYGSICVSDDDLSSRLYDLRYEKGNLHLLMIEDFFGLGLNKIVRKH